jgi:hypothetical protein
LDDLSDGGVALPFLAFTGAVGHVDVAAGAIPDELVLAAAKRNSSLVLAAADT